MTWTTPNSCGCAPPDNEVAVGTTQAVEIVNSELAVYSKTGGTLISAESTNTLWSGFGGGCQNNNDGDGTVTWDTMAQRWVIQQFSVSTTPFLDCVAISTSSDATGSYNRYSFQFTDFPDYPKLGVWSDAYYLSFNRFNGTNYNNYAGPEMCALNRAPMLTGAAATDQCFTPSSYFGSVLPATLDGTTPPPSGEPEWFLGINPNASNALAYFKFHVNWTTPSSSTLTGPTSLGVNSFTEACNGGTCIPQSGTNQKLDSLADRLMWRLEYRNFGDHEAMVVSHAVAATVGTTNTVGQRWYELRPTSTTGTGCTTAPCLSVYQQGTYAPDATYRWMGSIAMDHVGDMALGYSTSSGSLHPGVAYTGRLATDTLGTMPQGETTLYTGGGAQTGGLSRWGDYSEMSVDPADDCTFWYVNEYIPSNGSFNWNTRIGSFKFPGCSSSTGPTLSVSPSSVAAGGSVTVSWSGVANPSSTDWVGVYQSGAGNNNYVDWFYDDSCNKTAGSTALVSGSCSYKMPLAGGTYEFRLFSNDTWTQLATSNQVTDAGVSLSASPSSVPAGGSVTVSWSGVPSASSGDWVGVYPAGAGNGSYVDWFYDNSCSRTSGGTAFASGSCSYKMPTAGGTYEFRLFANDSWTELAASNQVAVASISFSASPSSLSAGSSVTVSWSGVGNASASDWVGVYVSGAGNNSYLDWFYDDSCTKSAGSTALGSGSCTYTMPTTAGTYEFRLFSNNSWTQLATTNQVTVG